MMENEQKQAAIFGEFIRNVAILSAFGDRRKDGTEVLWGDGYAEAQLSEVILNARLLTGAYPANTSAFDTPTRRTAAHPDCITTYPQSAR